MCVLILYYWEISLGGRHTPSPRQWWDKVQEQRLSVIKLYSCKNTLSFTKIPEHIEKSFLQVALGLGKVDTEKNFFLFIYHPFTFYSQNALNIAYKFSLFTQPISLKITKYSVSTIYIYHTVAYWMGK